MFMGLWPVSYRRMALSPMALWPYHLWPYGPMALWPYGPMTYGPMALWPYDIWRMAVWPYGVPAASLLRDLSGVSAVPTTALRPVSSVFGFGITFRYAHTTALPYSPTPHTRGWEGVGGGRLDEGMSNVLKQAQHMLDKAQYTGQSLEIFKNALKY